MLDVALVELGVVVRIGKSEQAHPAGLDAGAHDLEQGSQKFLRIGMTRKINNRVEIAAELPRRDVQRHHRQSHRSPGEAIEQFLDHDAVEPRNESGARRHRQKLRRRNRFAMPGQHARRNFAVHRRLRGKAERVLREERELVVIQSIFNAHAPAGLALPVGDQTRRQAAGISQLRGSRDRGRGERHRAAASATRSVGNFMPQATAKSASGRGR